MTYPPPKGLLPLLKAYPPEIRKVALAARQAVLNILAPCHENILQVYTVALGYGPNSRMRDQICHVTVHSKHVNLGFNFGAFLPDPEGILQGEGSQIRHIKLYSVDDVGRPAIGAYLRAALDMADVEDAEDRVTEGVVSVIKTPAAKKAARKAAARGR